MTWPGLRVAAAALLALWAVWVLEGARAGIDMRVFHVGATPVTELRGAEDGPVILVAHGFAGSRQIMQGYTLPLARAGYRVYVFDFEGHGRHPTPMSGDVSRIDGTTRLLVAQTGAVIDAVSTDATPVALLGHSMASDILVRAAANRDNIGPLVLLSAFSEAIDARQPRSLLLLAGQWEPGLSAFAGEAVAMVRPGAGQGETVTMGPVSRRAEIVPRADHVSILFAKDGVSAALDWLDRAYGRKSDVTVPRSGWALLGLLAALTALTFPLARLLPARRTATPPPLPVAQFAVGVAVPAALAPLVPAMLSTRVLPVLVADALALHLLIYGTLQITLLRWLRGPFAKGSVLAALALLVWALAVFGTALDRYGANFWPIPERLWIIAALCVGTVPFMLGDAWLADGAPLWQRLLARVALLGSLGLAVALNPSDLFFLAMIAPVIVLFWLSFGLMGRAVALRSGPAAAGTALGLVLAWALGVSFPLFEA